MTARGSLAVLGVLWLLACGTTSKPGGTVAAGGSASAAGGTASGTTGSGGATAPAQGGTSSGPGTGAANAGRGASSSEAGRGANSSEAGRGTAGGAGSASTNAGAPGNAGTTATSSGGRAESGGRAGAGTEQAGGKGAAGDGCDDGITVTDPSCLPAEEPSTQTVYFDVTNAATSEVYLVTSGSECTPYAIRAAGATADLVLGPLSGGDCPCGVACDSDTRSLIERLGPGETKTLTWDARDVQWRSLKIPDRCDPSATVTELVTIPRRVNAGQYSVNIGYYLPPPCEYCGAMPTYEYSFLPACRADHYEGSTFELPAEGDVRVPVQIVEPLGS